MKYAELTTKKDRIAFIKEKLGTNHQWAIKGLLRIYANQTEDEKVIEETREHNGIGFTGADANILSSFAKQISEKNRVMSEKQMNLIFKKMPKYARQLESVSN